MKAICVVKTASGQKTFNECESVLQALDLGKALAMTAAKTGHQDVWLEVYELVASAPVITTHVVKIEWEPKP